ncbi:MAG: leucine--tRNA ligase [Armatimonadetes bacterium]|nr:leucine--tRNA ligase [Armatimonadota bacterium]
MGEKYQPQAIEPKWQQRWNEMHLYRTSEEPGKPKYYCLDFFPYPSGDGLSVGHCRNYVPTDVVSRYKRMCGANVLHPMGWDAFGLPAENAAILRGLHPQRTTEEYAANYRRQLRLIGTSYDWEREINSSHPDYYKWTQWFFLLLYRRGLAYRSTAPANWCDSCKTVLANEETEGGQCWRCGSEVTKKDLPQWFFKITAYADRLLEDLDTIDWPEKIILMQRNWIGKSEGVEFDLSVKGTDDKIRVFTTRPDTVYGMTFAVLAPEHPLVDKLASPDRKAEVETYAEAARRETDIERLSTEKDRTGVFIGAYAVNPMNGREIPIFIGDYVLMSYGTGAIMAVPGHDTRDCDFAKKYGLPIPVVIAPPGWNGEDLPEAYVEEGTMVNSGPFNGLSSGEGWQRIADHMEADGIGQRRVNYRMRDWLISRQRYWGAPIPIIHCPTCGERPVPEERLPVELPHLESYQPTGTGKSPLAEVPEFVNTSCPGCGGPAERETDTMGGFACSSWYFLRYPNPHLETAPFSAESARYWLPVDLYVGGAEHAVMHLLYARFWTKVMYDAGLVAFKEPFQKLMNQGMILGADGVKMSKSKGNVITPDSVVAQFGADTLRLYELFIAPFEQEVAWSEQGIRGVFRFLNRLWGLVADNMVHFDPEWRSHIETTPENRPLRRKLHQTIRKVTQDIERMHFNTSVAALMELLNEFAPFVESGLSDEKRPVFSEVVENFILLLQPMAPHFADEIWERLGKGGTTYALSWPEWDEEIARAEEIVVVLQVNGKVKDRLTVPVDIAQADLERLALANEKVQAAFNGKSVSRVIVVPGKLVNIVAA